MSGRGAAQLGGRLPVGMADVEGNTALHLAARNDRDNATESMITLGAQVEARNVLGQTALYIACSRGCLKTAKVLVRQGGAYVDSEDDMGMRPIGVASRNGHLMIVQFLLSQMSMVDQPSYDERTPLMEAVTYEHVRVAKALLDAGADIDLVDEGGNTVLHMAVTNGSPEMVALLLEYDADPLFENYDLLTPRDLAFCSDNDDVLCLLQDDFSSHITTESSSMDHFVSGFAEKLDIRGNPTQDGTGQDSVMDQLVNCPITMDVMRDPVMATDGYCYERKAITSWLRSHGTSPMTKQRMSVDSLIPNRALKFFIEERSKRG